MAKLLNLPLFDSEKMLKVINSKSGRASFLTLSQINCKNKSPLRPVHVAGQILFVFFHG